MTAAEVSMVVGHVDLEVTRRHHVEMSAVVAELARDAEMDWPWTHDDPTVALVRAVALLALLAPDATSARAPSWCLRLQGRAADRAAVVPSDIEVPS